MSCGFAAQQHVAEFRRAARHRWLALGRFLAFRAAHGDREAAAHLRREIVRDLKRTVLARELQRGAEALAASSNRRASPARRRNRVRRRVVTSTSCSSAQLALRTLGSPPITERSACVG